MDYNDFIWNRLLDRKKVDKKLRNGFRFHHQITTDGVCVSILYSRQDPSGKSNKNKKTAVFTTECKPPQTEAIPSRDNHPLSKDVGLDPGKKNVATMIDSDGITLRYTSRQRLFESRLIRYREILRKDRAGVTESEAKLSKHSHRVNDAEEFMKYLEQKKIFDDSTSDFYRGHVWRKWWLRLHSARKSSEDRFLDKISSTYRKNCHIFYSMVTGQPVTRWQDAFLKAIKKRFHVSDVDEFRTSRTCNRCMGELNKYKKRDGRWSCSRLCCTGYWCPKDRLKRFVKTAANILLVGMSNERPAELRETCIGGFRF